MTDITSTAWAADLHIHSPYSRATSRELTPPHLARWAALKGLSLVGTGDLTHASWLAELEEHLTPAGDGLYRLAGDDGPAGAVRFVLTGEISCIYKKMDRVRKVHLVIIMPSLEAARRFNARLEKIGNLASDGRPILGLDARHALEMVLETDPAAELMPAHIWTPWFSVLGSKSGFDSIADCFDDLIGHIHAVETGLSSDPPMNWRVSSLDGYFLTSSSDAHSPANLGREATMFSGELSYAGLIEALRTGRGLEGTLEFFPEEGKYHLDGHRKCNVVLDPEETRALGGRCPVCGKPVTVGVLYRARELADRPADKRPSSARPFESLLSLAHVLSQVHGVGPKTKTVAKTYDKLLAGLGSELDILRRVPVEDIGRVAGSVAAEAVGRVRAGLVDAQGGFDGQYGQINIFNADELADIRRQGRLFQVSAPAKPKPQPAVRPTPEDEPTSVPSDITAADRPFEPDPDQRAAIEAPAGPVAIIAGPGSGKTGVVAGRLARFIDQGLNPDRVLGLTFTTKAAEELRDRVTKLAGREAKSCTFHALGLDLLQEWGLGRAVMDEEAQLELIRPLAKEAGLTIKAAAEAISRAKRSPQTAEPSEVDLTAAYNARLEAAGAYDYDDLLTRPLAELAARPDLAADLAGRFDLIVVDEFQDLNQTQYDWLNWLAPDPKANLTVVGDPDQSIYGFTGAGPRFFDRLTADRPAVATYPLTACYRCPRAIIQAAAGVIAPNPGRHLPLRAIRPGGGISLTTYPTAQSEAIGLVGRAERLIGGSSHLTQATGGLDGENDLSLGDLAVVARLHRQLEVIAEAFAQAGLPFQLAGDSPGRETDALERRADKISLLTIHAAKGLEFPVVMIAGAEDGLLPYRPPGKEADLEEERRLFYVAMTRAKSRLFISACKRRTLFGQTDRPGLSPYLADIPAELVNIIAEEPRQRIRPYHQPDLF